jgi:hypothetical protein
MQAKSNEYARRNHKPLRAALDVALETGTQCLSITRRGQHERANPLDRLPTWEIGKRLITTLPRQMRCLVSWLVGLHPVVVSH